MPIKHESGDSKFVRFDLDWLCSDNDAAELSFRKEEPTHFQLDCFSGMGASYMMIDQMDFGVFARIGVEWSDDFETMALRIADFICEKFGLERHVWEAQDGGMDS